MPTEPEIYGALTEIFHDVFMRDDLVLKPELSAKDVQGWDSFKQIEIIMATEERFGMKFTTRELDSLQCVGDLAKVARLESAHVLRGVNLVEQGGFRRLVHRLPPYRPGEVSVRGSAANRTLM